MPDKANTKVQAEQPAESKPNKYRDGRWSVPSKRAKGYAADRKAKVHTYGPKEGKELTVFEAGNARATMRASISIRRRSRKARASRKRGRSRAVNGKNKGDEKRWKRWRSR